MCFARKGMFGKPTFMKIKDQKNDQNVFKKSF